MKILLATVLIVAGGFISYVAVAGFIEKQNKEDKAQTVSSDSPSGAESAVAPDPSATKSYTTADVAIHNNPDDCWIIINNKVYGVSKYLQDHPGGASAISEYCGKEASKAFATQNRSGGGHSDQARSQLSEFQIGVLAN